MERKNRHIPSWIIEISIVAAVALLLWIFVGFRFQPNNAGSCLSVTFDKPFVKAADRIIVYETDGRWPQYQKKRKSARSLICSPWPIARIYAIIKPAGEWRSTTAIVWFVK